MKKKEERYCAVQDESCHWYVVTTSERERFQQLDESADFDTLDAEFSDKRINGIHTLTFTDPKERV